MCRPSCPSSIACSPGPRQPGPSWTGSAASRPAPARRRLWLRSTGCPICPSASPRTSSPTRPTPTAAASASPCRSSSGTTSTAKWPRRVITSGSWTRPTATSRPRWTRTSASPTPTRAQPSARRGFFATSCCPRRVGPTTSPGSATVWAARRPSRCSTLAAPCSTRNASIPTRSALPTMRGPTWSARSARRWRPPHRETPMIASTLARTALLLGVVTVAGCATTGKGHPEGQAPPGLTPEQRARLQLAAVAPTRFRPTTEVTGTVAFNGDISTQVLAPISGPVARILVEPGARVTRGQALAVVASPDYAADVAAYRKAEATAANLQRIADRDAQLFKNDALARRELEQAQTDAATAAADREAALEQLRALGVDSAGIEAIKEHRPVVGPQGVVRAPIAGTVVERLITPGQLLQAGATPCFTIADLSSVWVMAHVFEAQLPDVAIGDSAEARLTDDTSRVYRGRVTYVGALVNPDTRATDARILTPNPRER